MNATLFKRYYYLKITPKQITETEFLYRLIVFSKQTSEEITGIETKINFYQIDEKVKDSQFQFNQITWENILNQTIIMLFNALMFRIQLTDIYLLDGKEHIKEFFPNDPFFKE